MSPFRPQSVYDAVLRNTTTNSRALQCISCVEDTWTDPNVVDDWMDVSTKGNNIYVKYIYST